MPALKALGAALAGLVLIVWPYLYINQTDILFRPPGPIPEIEKKVASAFPEAQRIIVNTPDGVRLSGWLMPAKSPPPHTLVIYFGGNAEDVTNMLRPAELHLESASVLLVNYRGYGLSTGAPSEKTLYSDAELLYDTFAAGPETGHVVLMGRSLGAGLAVRLASTRRADAVILVSPYDSLVNVASDHFRFAPVGLLLRHRFEAASAAGSVHAPLLAIMAEKDRTVRMERSEALIAAWGGPKQAMIINGADHNSLGQSREFWDAISAFIRKGAANELPSN